MQTNLSDCNSVRHGQFRIVWLLLFPALHAFVPGNAGSAVHVRSWRLAVAGIGSRVRSVGRRHGGR